MRHILTAVAAIAACGLIATTAARAEQFQAGGPTKIGKMCLVNTSEMDAGNFGYVAPCPPAKQAKAVKSRKKKSS
jgi:phosphatidylethanolamine-binding protein (PEBP) family uncharacterized protein